MQNGPTNGLSERGDGESILLRQKLRNTVRRTSPRIFASAASQATDSSHRHISFASDLATEANSRERLGANLVTHSDRGVQYASEHYQRLLTERNITCSISRPGNCWDNAPTESFFATLKKELVYREEYLTRDAARASLFEYIETFYNRIGRHSTLNYLSPCQFEAVNHTPLT